MKLGNNDISTVKLGTSQVQAIYQGANLVWQNAPVATAATGVGQTSFTANWNAYTGATYYLLDVSLSSSFSTFVLENQFVLTNSYAVTGLSSNTTYYYRVRAVTDADTDVMAFVNRVYTATGSLSYTEVTALETLVGDLKNDGIWTKMKAIYPMVGASAAACAQNLKSSSFTGTFNGGVTFASTGVTGNGTTGYFDTNYNPVTDGLSVTSAHISAYTRQDETGNSGFGRFDRTTGVNRCLAVFIKESNNFYYEIGTGIATGSPATLNKGFHLVKSDGSTGKAFLNNVQKGSNFTAAGSFASANLRLLSLEITPFGVYYNQKECCFGSIGIGLSDTDSSNFYTAVQAFQTTLSRNV